MYENGIPERCKVIGVEIYVDFFLAHKASCDCAVKQCKGQPLR